MNLIKNEEFFYLSSIFKIDSTKLKSLLLSNNFKYVKYDNQKIINLDETINLIKKMLSQRLIIF